MSLSTRDRARLLARAREELPVPGDPRRLIDDMLEAGLGSPEALEVIGRSGLAWRQVRDLQLERAWQAGFGWFLARNLIVFGAVMLLLFFVLRPPPMVLDGALAGAAISYLVTMALSPLRLSRHRRRRQGILDSYGEDLRKYLAQLEP